MSLSVSPFNPTQQAGVRAKAPPDLIIINRAPVTTDFAYFVGQLWLWPNNSYWGLLGFTAPNVANWAQLGGGTVAVASLHGDTGIATPISGVINVYGNTSPAATGLTFTGTAGNLALGGTLNVSHGGTGDTTFTTNAPLLGNGTSAIHPSSTVLFNDSTGGYTFIKNTAGTNTSLAVENSDTTNAGSAAGIITAVGGTSSGDAYFQSSSNGTSYTWGTQTSSGNWILSSGASLTSTRALVINSLGNATISTIASVTNASGLFEVQKSFVGSPVQIQAVNNDTTNTGSNAQITARSGGAGGGDAYFSAIIGGVLDWDFGIDHVDNSFRLGTGGPPSALVQDCFNITSVGVPSFPIAPLAVPSGGTGDTTFTAYSVLTGGTTPTGALQNVSGIGTSGQVLTSNGASALPTWQGAGSVSSAFFFNLSSNTSANLTGDGTAYVIGTDTLGQVAQTGSSMTTSCVYTAASTGWFYFFISVNLLGLLNTHTSMQLIANINGSAETFVAFGNPFTASSSGNITYNGSALFDLSATNTVTFTLTVSGGTKVVGLGGTSGAGRTYIMGYKVA